VVLCHPIPPRAIAAGAEDGEEVVETVIEQLGVQRLPNGRVRECAGLAGEADSDSRRRMQSWLGEQARRRQGCPRQRG